MAVKWVLTVVLWQHTHEGLSCGSFHVSVKQYKLQISQASPKQENWAFEAENQLKDTL